MWIETVSLYTLKQMMSIKKLQKMLKQGLKIQIVTYKDHYKIKKQIINKLLA